MSVIQAIILGVAQGVTEFLPISSSGHLILIPSLFGWKMQDLTFDIILHLGTALAVLIFFWKDWYRMFLSLFTDIKDPEVKLLDFTHIKKLRRPSQKLIAIFISAIPVGIAGVLLENTVENSLRSPALVAFMLIFIGVFMYVADMYHRNYKRKVSRGINFWDVLIVSLSQINALIPGTSRSGITIATGLFRGINRAQAAKLSFLLATPLILGAAVLRIPELLEISQNQYLYLSIGFLASFFSGIIAIKWLLKFLQNNTLTLFVLYRFILGGFIFILIYLGLI